MRRFIGTFVFAMAALPATWADASSLFDLPSAVVSLITTHTGATAIVDGGLTEVLDGDIGTVLLVGSDNNGVAGGGMAGIEIDVTSVTPFILESASAKYDAYVDQDFRPEPSISRVVYARFEAHVFGGDWLTLVEQRDEHHQPNPGHTEVSGGLSWTNPANLGPFDQFRTLVIAEGGVFDTNFDPTTVRRALLFDLTVSVPEPSTVWLLAFGGALVVPRWLKRHGQR